MVGSKPKDDPIARYDPESGKCILAGWYKQSISDVIPQGIKPTAAFWLLLTDIISKFLLMKKCRAARRSPAAEIKRWQRMAKLATEVIETATAVRVKSLADNQLQALRAFQGDFSRKYNRNNEVLYIWILEDLWCGRLGQELGVSINNDVPGPLIKFFSACVNPLLNKPLTPGAIVSIRDRVRGRREKIAITSKVRARKRIKAQ
jgi:hypothetical protein